MEAVIGAITKVCDFLGGVNYVDLFDKVEAALIKVVEWIASLIG